MADEQTPNTAAKPVADTTAQTPESTAPAQTGAAAKSAPLPENAATVENTAGQQQTSAVFGEKNWYVVHTQTGHEDKVREKILTQKKVQNFEDRIFEVLVPTEQVVEVKQNKKIERKRKFFPGYILVEMILTSESYWFIRNISGVSGFLGDPSPVPLPEEEITGIVELTSSTEGKPRHAVQFSRGEQVRVTEGPFKHFVGVIEDVNETKNKLKVMVTVFDRATPVEVDYLQVEKIN